MQSGPAVMRHLLSCSPGTLGPAARLLSKYGAAGRPDPPRAIMP